MSKRKEELLYFIPLGGCGEIGMNAAFYGDGEQWLMVDCGITFSKKPEGVLMPDIRPFLKRIKKLHGLVLTHAHEDHYGGVAHLWKYLNCPVYATPFSAHLLRHKLREAKISLPLKEMPLKGSVDIGPFHIQFVSLTHSIPEPNALAITFNNRTVVHTGDWKIDPHPMIGDVTDVDSLIQLGEKGVEALVCDSTNVFESGTSGSEWVVREKLIHHVGEGGSGMVIVACFASNVARMKSCFDAAQACGRKVVLAGKSLLRMEEAARHCGYFGDDVHFLTPKEAQSMNRSKLLVITTGSQAEPRAALTRMAQNQHPLVRLEEGDTVIFSSRIIPGNEEAIFELQNLMTLMGLKIITHKDAEDIHVSGHPYREELGQMYGWLKPRIAIPVHGEDRHIYEHARLAHSLGVPEVIRPHNGQLFRLSPGPVELVESFPATRLYLDGKELIPANGIIMRERRELLENGIVYVSLMISRQMRQVIGRHFIFCGICEDEKEERAWEKHLGQEVEHALPDTFQVHQLSDQHVEGLKEKVAQAVRQAFYFKVGKKPLVRIQMMWA